MLTPDENARIDPIHPATKPARPHIDLGPVLTLYWIESMASIGGTLMSVGIFFFMKYQFGWQTRQNFLLAMGQGIIYIPGALLAGRVAGRWGPRRTLAGVYAVLAGLTCMACMLALSGAARVDLAVAATLLAYTFTIGISWPILEGLVASCGRPAGLARRVSLYNVIWPASGALAIAVEGTILHFWLAGLFLIPGILHLSSLVVLVLRRTDGSYAGHASEAVPLIEPETELLRKRQLALWLSRTALPATYTVIYGLMPMMPSLPVMRPLPTTLQTAVASVWLFTRWLAFVILALSAWWHTRPRALLWAAVVMLIAFFGMTLRPTQGASPTIDLVSLIAWQAVLGLALGMIYSGSLYFGMVLSDGSTRHGGYHEALIGVGWLLGPAAGAAAEAMRPNDLWLGIIAVGAVIAASVGAVILTSVVLGRRSNAKRDALGAVGGLPELQSPSGT